MGRPVIVILAGLVAAGSSLDAGHGGPSAIASASAAPGAAKTKAAKRCRIVRVKLRGRDGRVVKRHGKPVYVKRKTCTTKGTSRCRIVRVKKRTADGRVVKRHGKPVYVKRKRCTPRTPPHPPPPPPRPPPPPVPPPPPPAVPPPPVPPPPPDERGSLRVEVSDLPSGIPGRVEVSGPDHRSSIAASTTLGDLKPGTYTLSAKPVPVGDQTFEPTIKPAASIQVSARQTATATVSYLTVIPDTTKLLAADDVTGIALEPDGTITIPPGRPSVAVGDVLVAPVTASTPYGLANKVTAATTNGDGSMTLSTVVARLDEIASRGAVDVSVPLDIPKIPSDPRVARGTGAPLQSGRAFAGCQAQSGLSLTPSVSFSDAHADFAASWDQAVFSGIVKASVTANLGIRIANLSGAVACAWKLLPNPVTVATFVVPIGPIPVIWSVRFDPAVEVTGAIGTGETLPLLELAGSATIGGGVSILGTVATPINLTSLSLTPPSFDYKEITATARGTLQSRFNVAPLAAEFFTEDDPNYPGLVYVSLAAPYVEYVHNDPARNPCWQVNAGADLEAGYDVFVTAFNVSIPLVQFPRIFDSGGPCTDPTITTTSLPDGTVGQSYSAALAASGGRPPYRWTAFGSPGLPPGVTLDETLGTLGGTPTTPGTYDVLFEVTDSDGDTGVKSLTITVADEVRITTTSLADATSGTPYTASIDATGGTPPYDWALAPGSGSLPPGLALTGSATSAQISGTPGTEGAYTFDVQVTDSHGRQDVVELTITVVIPCAPGTVIDFEGYASQLIEAICGLAFPIAGSNAGRWYGADSSGNPRYCNPPTTIGYSTTQSDSFSRIDFRYGPASRFSFKAWGSISPGRVEARTAQGSVVASAPLPEWDRETFCFPTDHITLTSGTRNIASIFFVGFIGSVDDIATDAPMTP